MAGGPVIVAGFGFRAGASAASLMQALERACRAPTPDRVTALATATDKAATTAFRDFARAQALPVHPVDADMLARQETATRSAASIAARGTGSLAEAAALAAAGPGGRLIAARVVSADGMATCALAEGKTG